MTDREKVITGLEYCAASCKGAWDENNGCPYMSDFIKLGPDYNGRCVDLLCKDALALLKAQEPVEPKWEKGYAYCGQCRYKLHWIVDLNNFCPNCGRPVKWE